MKCWLGKTFESFEKSLKGQKFGGWMDGCHLQKFVFSLYITSYLINYLSWTRVEKHLISQNASAVLNLLCVEK